MNIFIAYALQGYFVSLNAENDNSTIRITLTKDGKRASSVVSVEGMQYGPFLEQELEILSLKIEKLNTKLHG